MAWLCPWRKGLADEAAQAARVRFARTATAGVEAVGRYLYVAGDLMRDDLAAGVSLAAWMGGALARGTAALLDGGNAYGAAALLRQVVEVEYLFWTFAADPKHAARWLHAWRSQLEGRFRRATMRKRSEGRFHTAEYQPHCDQGGDPSPRGWLLVGGRGWWELGRWRQSEVAVGCRSG